MQVIRSREQESPQQRAQWQLQSPVLESDFVSDAGGKPENQDAFGYLALADGTQIFLVADGLGGHKGGRRASELAIAAFEEYALDGASGIANKAGKESLRFEQPLSFVNAFYYCNQRLLAEQQAQPELSKMRTTLVVLAIKDSLAFWIHVGDVRLYLFRAGEVMFQTRDHSVPQMLADSGEIDYSEIRNHPDRSKLLNALGNPSCKPAIPTRYQQLQPGDIFHLSTDGYWEWVLEKTLIKYLGGRLPLARASLELERQVRLNAERSDPDHDNYTACHVRVTAAQLNRHYWHKTAFQPLSGKGK